MSEIWQLDYNPYGRDEDEYRWERYRRAQVRREGLRGVGTDPAAYLDEDRDENTWD